MYRFHTKSLRNHLFCRFAGIPLPEQQLATASVAVLLRKELKSSIKILLISDAQKKAVWTPIMPPTRTEQIQAKWLQEIVNSQSGSQAEPQEQEALAVIILGDI